MKLIVAITGASGTSLAYKFINNLPSNIDIHLVVSSNANYSNKLENATCSIKNTQNITIYNNKDIGAAIASGSFGADAMIILPCSMNTLAKCAVGISDNLITRAFSVMLKERKKVILAPREMPYSTLVLENMTKLSNYGVIIAPPVLGYYSEQQTLDDMENFMIGKWFDLLNIENNMYKRWRGNE